MSGVTPRFGHRLRFLHIRIMKFSFLVLIFFALHSSWASNERALPLVAVNQLEGVGLDSSLVRMSTDRLRSELIKLGEFRILERSQMDAILAEQAFQQSGCVAEECVVQMGQLLGADFIIAGSAGRVQDLVSLSLKFISVENGEILHSVDQANAFSVDEMLNGMVPSLAMKLTKAFLNGGQVRVASMPFGDLFVETNPSGAQVWLDDELQNGQTPITISRVAPGTHVLRARRDMQGASRTVNLEPHGLEKVYMDLLSLSSSLRIKSEPAECDIWLDGHYLGLKTPYLLKAVPQGGHEIRLEKRGRLPVRQQVDLQFGETTELSLVLKPAAMVALSSKRYPYQVRLDNGEAWVLDRDTLMNLEPGLHEIRIQALPAEDLVFETVVQKWDLAVGHDIAFQYEGLLDPGFVEARRQHRKSLLRWSSAAVAAAGMVGFIMNQREHDRLYKLYNRSDTQSEFDARWKEAEKSKVRRDIGTIVFLIGAIGFGVSYAF